MNQPYYSNSYYVLASIDGMIDNYAIKEVKSNVDLEIDNKLFEFDIDKANILYIGKDKKVINSVARIEFSLNEYRTKINNDVYKIKLKDALSRLVYGCDTIFANAPITAKLLADAFVLGEERHHSFDSPAEITDITAKAKVISAFKLLESNWLSYWKNNYYRLLAFNNKYPPPLKKNYFRNGISAFVFGKFNESDYTSASINYHNKSRWLIDKLSEESKSLSMDFNSSCPNGCGRTIFYGVHVHSDYDKNYYYIDDDFPFGVYKFIKNIEGSCPECGSFSINYDSDPNNDENFTCVFDNRHPEIVNFSLRKRIESINKYIVDKLSE